MPKHIIATTDEIPPAGRKIVTVKGREIGVFNLNGTYYALRNICPHRTGPLCRGRVRPLVLPEGMTGMKYEREGEILKCPWHQWEFDIKSGQALYDPQLRVRTYRVEVEDEKIVLYV